MNKKILVLMSLIVLISISTNVLAVGLSPSFFYLDEVIRGNNYEKNFRVLNFEDSDVFVTLGSTGDSQDWINFYDIETGEEISTLEVPGKSSVLYKVAFEVPEDTPNGVYEGYITVTPEIEESNDTTINVVTRNIYQLQVSGTENIAGTIDGISTQDTESGQPLKIQYGFRNTGNVGATPTAKFAVYKDGNFVDSSEVEGQYVKRGTFFNQEFFWDTENRGTGNFTADVEITLDGKIIKEEKLTFNIAPRGTYTVEVLIGEVIKPKNLVVNAVGKTEIKFYNKGKISVTAKVVAEVVKNGQVVDVINGDELSIDAGGSNNLYFYFKPYEEGEYTIKPTVLFGGKENELEPFTLNVQSETEGLSVDNLDSESDNSTTSILLILVGVLLAIIIIFGYIYIIKPR